MINELLYGWTHNLLIKRPDMPPAAIAQTINAMNAAFPEALIDLNKAPVLDPEMPGKDDKHVLEAAAASYA